MSRKTTLQFLVLLILPNFCLLFAQGESVFVFQPATKVDDKITATDARVQSGASSSDYDSIPRKGSSTSIMIYVVVRSGERDFLQKIADALKEARRQPGYEKLPVQMVWGDPEQGKTETIVYSRGWPEVRFTKTAGEDESKIISNTQNAVKEIFQNHYAILKTPIDPKYRKKTAELTVLEISGKTDEEIDTLLLAPLEKKYKETLLANKPRPGFSQEQKKKNRHISNLVRAHFSKYDGSPELGTTYIIPLKRDLLKRALTSPSTSLSAAIDLFMDEKYQQIYEEARAWRGDFDALSDKEMISQFNSLLMGETFTTVKQRLAALDGRIAVLNAQIVNSRLQVRFAPSLRDPAKGKLIFVSKDPKILAFIELQCEGNGNTNRIEIDIKPRETVLLPYLKSKQPDFARGQRCELFHKDTKLRSFFVTNETNLSNENWVLDDFELILTFKNGEINIYDFVVDESDNEKGYYSKNGNRILFGIPDRALTFEGTIDGGRMNLIVTDKDKKQKRVIALVE